MNTKYNSQICSVDGCNQKAHKKGYCRKHYDRYIVRGKKLKNKLFITPTESTPQVANSICTHIADANTTTQVEVVEKKISASRSKRCCQIEGCTQTHFRNDYCLEHYRKYKMIKQCKVEGCDQRHYGRGYCRKHYDLYVKGNPLYTCMIDGCNNTIYRSNVCKEHFKKDLCVIPDCQNKRYVQGLCKEHYAESLGIKVSCWHTNCTQPIYRDGLCKDHFQRGRCSVPGCFEKRYANRLCKNHYIESLVTYENEG